MERLKGPYKINNSIWAVRLMLSRVWPLQGIVSGNRIARFLGLDELREDSVGEDLSTPGQTLYFRSNRCFMIKERYIRKQIGLVIVWDVV